MELFDLINDASFGHSGEGSQINIYDEVLGKYKLWIPTESVPSVIGSTETIEHRPTTSRVVGQIDGQTTLDSKDVPYLWCRQNNDILDKNLGKVCKFLNTYPDGTGWKFQGYVSMYQDEVTLGAALTGKAVITVSSADDLPIDDVSDIIEETVTFISAVDDVVKISGTNTYSIVVETDPSDATIAATSATTAVATATVSGQTITLTGVKAGSSIVEVKATKSGCADGVTHILVVVTE